MTIINIDRVYDVMDIKRIISREYGVRPKERNLELYERRYGSDRAAFGFYIGREGYDTPVCFQNENGQLEIIRKKDYFDQKYFKEMEEKQIPAAAKKRA